LVMPSIWYETFGRVIIESYAVGTPVLVSNMGAMRELVIDGKTGLLFQPGDGRDLASKADRMITQPEKLRAMRLAARRLYEEKYTAARNYELLMVVYDRALDGSSASPPTEELAANELTDDPESFAAAGVSDGLASTEVNSAK
jgi:glycosyltransferase involved in cell wall biosynthesis